jgi:serine/threonine-protein phosphatase 6 regulatory subunit 3
MFWRFGFHNSSSLDTILERENAILDDIMAEEELLTEVKAENNKVIELYLDFNSAFVRKATCSY